MGIEIERKFLVIGDTWRQNAVGVIYRQGYISSVRGRTVRVRLAGDEGYLTVKGLTTGITRPEFEYKIPLEDAIIMLDIICEKPLIEKQRYTIQQPDGMVWEVDEFMGENKGLIIAEVELEDENQKFDLPPWVGKEVSGDPRYSNSSLAKYPYSKWA